MSPRIDWNAAREAQARQVPPVWREGIYLAEVSVAAAMVSKRGDDYFRLTLCAPDFGMAVLCEDILMLAGKGLGIGATKLHALGIPDGQEFVESHELLGLQVYAALALDEFQNSEGAKQERMQVNIAFPSSKCGYWPVDAPPDAPIMRPKRPTEPLSDDPDQEPF
jgi:hypothetical protein